MNFEKLFEIQAGLDEHIIQEKGLQGQDLLDKKILALQVELGELANEWRGFKFWKVNQRPRTKIEHLCPVCEGEGMEGDTFEENEQTICEDCEGTGKIGETNPLLEEYVDCLHFILSIGLERSFIESEFESVTDQENDITKQFNYLFNKVGDYHQYKTIMNFAAIVALFDGLGKMLGFTEEQIEAAYLEKNRVNHERQNTGY